jgi:hypothetical protein
MLLQSPLVRFGVVMAGASTWLREEKYLRAQKARWAKLRQATKG